MTALGLGVESASRVCTGCSAKLSAYNDEPYCHACQERRRSDQPEEAKVIARGKPTTRYLGVRDDVSLDVIRGKLNQQAKLLRAAMARRSAA